ncbi:MAG: DUF1292 domain-containing protein [Clostridia bacterium]|nr:DUF1292 domain-containing protein [Clostridia bacterium]
MLPEDEMSFETFILPMEDGTEQEFAILDEFEFEGKGYILVSAVEDDELSEELVLYNCEYDGDDMIINYIEDEEEYKRVAEAYDAMEESED